MQVMAEDKEDIHASWEVNCLSPPRRQIGQGGAIRSRSYERRDGWACLVQIFPRRLVTPQIAQFVWWLGPLRLTSEFFSSNR